MMVRQIIIKPLPNGALVRSARGKTYEAVFKSKVMQIPHDAIDAEVKFENRTPVITQFYYPAPENATLEEQEEKYWKIDSFSNSSRKLSVLS